MLVAGAKIASHDVTAVQEDGKQFFAGLVQCEDDTKLRKSLVLDEFQPIVQVVSRTWHGSYGKFPNLQFVVTDGTDEMSMRVSYRTTEIPILFFSKKGPFNSGHLNKGKKFKLLDYTCDLQYEKGGTSLPIIYVEKIRPEPRKAIAKRR
jgi:hypothetical protein